MQIAVRFLGQERTLLYFYLTWKLDGNEMLK